MNDFKIKMDNLFGNTQTRMREVDQIFYQEMLDIRDRLDELEKEDIVKEDIPDLQAGAFLHLLDNDKIEGVTKNTEGWLENFRGLTVFKK